MVAPDNAAEIQALEADRGSYLGYVRVVGRRRAEARLDEPIVSIPSEYAKKPEAGLTAFATEAVGPEDLCYWAVSSS